MYSYNFLDDDEPQPEYCTGDAGPKQISINWSNMSRILRELEYLLG